MTVLSISLAGMLPEPKADAVLTATLLGFAIYTLAILSAFAARTARQAWLGLLVPTALGGALAWLHTWAGLIALSLAMDRHYRQLRPYRAPPSTVARHLWWMTNRGLLTLSIGLVLQTWWGKSVGIVAWFGVLIACLLLLAWLLPYRPRRTRHLAKTAIDATPPDQDNKNHS